MSLKKVHMLVDNRHDQNLSLNQDDHLKLSQKNQTLKYTEPDCNEGSQEISPKDYLAMCVLVKKIECLQERIRVLEGEKRILKKRRRRANEMVKEYKCKQEECGRVYGSETSLKLHYKLKH